MTNILNSLFSLILSFVIATLNLILAPLYLLLKTLLPFGFEDIIIYINQLINSFINFVPFIADLTFIPAPVIHIIVDFLIFKYTILFSSWLIKNAIRWWNILKV